VRRSNNQRNIDQDTVRKTGPELIAEAKEAGFEF